MFTLNSFVKTVSSIKRVGRGYASGLGKTCGRGSNGQNARSGRCAKRNFDGSGQNKFFRSVPKRGFCSIQRRPSMRMKRSSISSLKCILVKANNDGVNKIDINFLKSKDFMPNYFSKFKIISSDESKSSYLKDINKMTFIVDGISGGASDLLTKNGHKVVLVKKVSNDK